MSKTDKSKSDSPSNSDQKPSKEPQNLKNEEASKEPSEKDSTSKVFSLNKAFNKYFKKSIDRKVRSSSSLSGAPSQFASSVDLDKFGNPLPTERLSKRIAKLGYASRR